MRDLLSLVLIVAIGALGVAERFQDEYADQVASIDAAPAQTVHADAGPRAEAAQADAAQADAESSSGARPSGPAHSSAEPPAIPSVTRSNAPQMASIQWSEAESFLEHIEQQAQDLEGRDVDRFNALIREAGRITSGLSPELRPQFRRRLFAVIDKASELPPLPEDTVFEFEKE